SCERQHPNSPATGTMYVVDDGFALIFDMDGVIIDSTGTHTEAWRYYLRRHGIEVDQIADRMLGKHNADLVREFFAAGELSEEDVLRHGAQKEELYRQMMAPIFEGKLVAGVREFIHQNAHRPIAVATNAEYPNIDFTLDRAGLRPFVRAIVNGDEVARPKPAPDIYLQAARLLEKDPRDCIVFEDSTTGIAAARAAHMRVVGLTTTLPVLRGVDLEIRDFRDPALARWLLESNMPV
ncbi:MAG TPA: HAD family phosphatase, partial [Bryobacteraceae bacterium]|nr:HAD family phosphatase [Bryobacteraceae bacterium]